MENLSTPTTPSIKEQVQQLRQENLSLREIAKRLDITKYKVETTLKELDAERVRTNFQPKVEESQPLDESCHQPVQTSGQPLEIPCRTPENPSQPAFLKAKNAPDDANKVAKEGDSAQEIQLNTAENAVETAKKACFYAVFSFKIDYRRYLKDFQRDIQQKRCYWRHHIEDSLLTKLKNLQKRGQYLAQEQGLEYNELLLSGVLQACESYLENVLRFAPVVHTLFNLRSLRFPPNKALVDLCQRAQQMEFDFVEPKHDSAAA